MPKRVTPLTPSQVANAKAKADPYKLRDGAGLYLVVNPDRSRWWRWDYRRPNTGKRNTLGLGTFPTVSLRRAREKCSEARELLADGIDPGVQRIAQKRVGKEQSANSFEVVAREWLAVKASEWMDETRKRATSWLENNVFPVIGERPIAELEYDAPALLDVMRRMVARGAVDSAHRVREHIGSVFRYAIATGRAKHDPAADLRDALPKAQGKHFAALTKPDDIAALLRAIDGYQGLPITRAALALSPLVFQRPGEVRNAEWSNIDLDAGEWRVPGSGQKLKKADKENPRTPDHIVPLSSQAVAILFEVQSLTGRGRYVFPGAKDSSRPMSNNAVRSALRRMGYTGEEMTAHGFRHMASTRLNEMSVWNPDAIEAELSHNMPGIRGVYAGRAKFLDERRKMMQAWADYLDALRAGVVPIRKAS